MKGLGPLVRERARLVAAASRHKRDHAGVQASERVQAVVDNVRAAAARHSLGCDDVEARYRRVIESYVQWEARCFEERDARSDEPAPPPLVELRMRIDELDRQIVAALAAGATDGDVVPSGRADEDALVARVLAILT
jgi:chorismate mutase